MAKKGTGEEQKKEKRSKAFKRRVLTAFLLLLILYVGLHAIARTDGVRSIVTDKISNFTQQPVSLEVCSASALLGLNLRGLAFYGVKMPRVTVEWNWLALFSETKPFIRKINIYDMEAKLKRIPTTGKWDPLVLHGLGNRLGAVLGLEYLPLKTDTTLPHVPAILLNEKTAVQIHRAKAVWHGADGQELAYVDDADVSVRVVKFHKREAIQMLLTSGHMQMAGGKLIRDFELETIKIDGYKPVLVIKMASRNLEYDGFESKTLWLDLYSRLDSLGSL